MFSDLHQVQWEPVSATKTCLMFCCFYYKQWEPAFSKNFGPQLEAFKGWPWPWQGMQWTEGEVSRIPKMPLTHFFRKSAGPGFDVLVMIWKPHKILVSRIIVEIITANRRSILIHGKAAKSYERARNIHVTMLNKGKSQACCTMTVQSIFAGRRRIKMVSIMNIYNLYL